MCEVCSHWARHNQNWDDEHHINCMLHYKNMLQTLKGLMENIENTCKHLPYHQIDRLQNQFYIDAKFILKHCKE